MLNESLVVQSSITVLQGWVKLYWRFKVKEKRLHGLSDKVRTKITYKSTGTRSSRSTSYWNCSRQKKCTSGLLMTWRKWSTGRRSRLMVQRLQWIRTCLCCGTWPKSTLPKRSEEEMDMDGGFNSDIDGNLCEGGEQHQVTSVLIWIFV